MLYYDYLARGWRVLPLYGVADGVCLCGKDGCGSPGKHPLIHNGSRGASSKQATVEKWFEQWPHANLGIATSTELGVLDIDSEDGLREIESRYGPLPPTMVVKTARGWHYYFRGHVLQTAGKHARGVDTRGEGGYVVAPPSIHATGHEYVWLPDGPDEPALAPEWLSTPVGTKLTLRAIPVGERNDAVYKRACLVRSQGATEAEMLEHVAGMPLEEPLDDSEMRAIVHSAAKRPQGGAPPRAPWETEYARDSNGKVRTRIQANTEVALQNLSLIGNDWGFDEALQVNTHKREPITEEVVSWIRVTLERHTSLEPSMETLHAAMNAVCKRSSYHSLRDEISILKWDGTPRVDAFPLTRLKCTSDPEYASRVWANFMIGNVARCFEPACQVDVMPVLEGPQGIGKNSAVMALFGKRRVFIGSPERFEKDLVHLLFGKRVIFVDELEIRDENYKRFRSLQTMREVTFRAPYARDTTNIDVWWTWIGATNDKHYIGDPDGARRFSPLACSGPIDVEGISRDRDQLWAEAYVRYRRDEKWYLEPHTAHQEREQRVTAEPWLEVVVGFLVGKEQVRSQDVFRAIGLEPSRQTKKDEWRLGKVMRTLGWTSTTVRKDGKVTRVWRLM